jgi:hypothetical protein
MFFKLTQYIITILLAIILFYCIPNKFNPIVNIYFFILLFLLIFYFFDTCKIYEKFSKNNKGLEKFDSSNNNIESESKEQEHKEEEKTEEEKTEEEKTEKEEEEKTEKEEKDISNNTCNTKIDDELITLKNVHINIQNLILPYLEKITYNNNTIKIKPEINDLIISIKKKNDPIEIYIKIKKIVKILEYSNSELYLFLKNISIVLKTIIYQEPLKSPEENNRNNTNLNSDVINTYNNLYITKHFLPLFENLLLVAVSYNKLPKKLHSEINDIIDNIKNNELVYNILNKIKNIQNEILILLKNNEMNTDKTAKTYLLIIKATLDSIIKNVKLLILQETINYKSEIVQLSQEIELIMKVNLGKLLKFNISLELNPSEESDIKTYLLVDFNPSIETISINNNDSSNTQISEMLKKLASKLENDNNECNCEKKVNEAVEKYLKNGKYIDDNGIIKNIMNSDMIYNQLDINMLQSLGSYDDSFSNKWDKGYTYLDTAKWNVPKIQIPSPPNINNIKSSLTPGYPINVLEFDNSRKILGPDQINLEYIKDKLN